jgi:hypothetical protein
MHDLNNFTAINHLYIGKSWTWGLAYRREVGLLKMIREMKDRVGNIKLIDIICISKLWEVGGLHLSPGFHTQKKYDLDFPDAGSTPLKRSSVDCSGRITLHYSRLVGVLFVLETRHSCWIGYLLFYLLRSIT